MQADELRVTIEMGDDYQPSEELAAVLSELAAVLSEGDDEVSGFELEPIRSFTYTSLLNARPPLNTGDMAWDNTKHVKWNKF